MQQLKHSPHPLVVYDHDAAEIKNSDEVCGAVALTDFQQVMVLQGLPLFDSQDALVSFLQHQHHQVMS